MSSPVGVPSAIPSQPRPILDFLEQIVKITAGLLAIVYAVGFLVVSIQHGRYGVLMFEFLRARVFAAGLLFAAFITVPLIAASRMFALFGLGLLGGTRYVKEENLKYAKICSIARFAIFSYALAAAASPLFSSGYLQANGKFRWFILGFGGIVVAFISERKWIDTSFASIIAAINICAAAIFLFSIFKLMSRDIAVVTMWFYGVGAGFLLLHMVYSGDSENIKRTSWEEWLFFSLTFIVIFATTIYARIKPYWGGGMIPAVTIHFVRTTSFATTNDATAFLIDETEKGFYITHKLDDNNATFIPREAVGSVDFSVLE